MPRKDKQIPKEIVTGISRREKGERRREQGTPYRPVSWQALRPQMVKAGEGEGGRVVGGGCR